MLVVSKPKIPVHFIAEKRWQSKRGAGQNAKFLSLEVVVFGEVGINWRVFWGDLQLSPPHQPAVGPPLLGKEGSLRGKNIAQGLDCRGEPMCSPS